MQAALPGKGTAGPRGSDKYLNSAGITSLLEGHASLIPGQAG